MKRIFIGLCFGSLLFGAMVQAQSPPVVHYGETVNGTLSSEIPRVEYVFEAAANDVVTIHLTALDGPTLIFAIMLIDPDGETIIQASGSDLRNVTIAEDGQHTIVLEAVFGEGQFSMSLIAQGSTVVEPFIVFSEDFEDNSAGWGNDGIPEDVFVDADDGLITISTNTPRSDFGWFVSPGVENWGRSIILVDEFSYEVEVSNLKTSNGKYNIALYFAINEARDGYRYWTLNQDGYLQFFQKPDYADMEIPMDAIFIPPVDFTDGTHTIGIFVINYETFVLAIDGELVYTYENITLHLNNGAIGFSFFPDQGGRGEISASFDNVAVRVLSGETRANVLQYENRCMVSVFRNPSTIWATPAGTEVVDVFDYSARFLVSGQTTINGIRWWQFGEGRWGNEGEFAIRQDVDCSDVPVVDG
jgi:hypothetical protein